MSLHNIKLQLNKERVKWLELYCNRDSNLGIGNLGIGCFKEKANYLGSSYIKPNYSALSRQTNSIKFSKGKTQFASLQLNDYGKIEGSSGGYGSSIKNRF